jgi:MFS family permease
LKARGKQVGARAGLVIMAKFCAPLVGGILINTYGFWTAFITASVVMLFAVLPLLRLPDVPLPTPINFKKALRKVSKQGFIIYFAWGIYEEFNFLAWTLVLFLLIGNYIYFGGLLSFAIVFQIIGNFIVGHWFDNGTAKRIFGIGFLITALTIISRSLFAYTIPVIIILDMFFMLGTCLSEPALESVFYNTSKKSSHPLWYQFFAETGWDVGSSFFLLLASLFLYLGGDLRNVMLFSIFGLLGMAVILRRYFKYEHNNAIQNRTM